MTRALAAIVVALLAVACAPSRVELPATLAIDPAFTSEQVEIIVSAAEEWRKATGGVADLSPVLGTAGEITIRPGALDGDVDGHTDFDRDQHAAIRIDLDEVGASAKPHTFADALRDTTMHELGHAFGLEHTSTGLMSPMGYGGGCVDAESVARFCAAYECPPGTGSTCEVSP